MLNSINNNIIEPRLTDIMIRSENLPVNINNIINHVVVRFVIGCMRFEHFDPMMGAYDGHTLMSSCVFVSDSCNNSRSLYKLMKILDQAGVRFGVLAGYNCSIEKITVDFSGANIQSSDQLKDFVALTDPDLWNHIRGWLV